MNDKKEVIWMIIIGILAVILIGVFVHLNKEVVERGVYEGSMSLERLSELSTCPLTEDKDSFAKCLTEKGWTLYGAVWCSHCKDQKELFGESFRYIHYVECPDNTELCLDKGINGYPTWKVEK